MIDALRRYVGARVVRRFFLVFVICAFLPLVLVATLSFIQVRDLFLQQADQRLAATAKAYGMSFFERLQLASDVAMAAVTKPDTPIPKGTEARVFDALAEIHPDGSVRAVIGAPQVAEPTPSQKARLAAGKEVVRLVPAGTTSAVEVLTPLAAGRGFVAGRLKPFWLWGDPDDLPALTDFCVVTHGQVLYCSETMPESALAGQPDWQRNGQRQRSKSWTQFLRAAFGEDDWTIIASQPESYPLARAAQFARVYVPAVLMALLLVLWFTLRQSRDIAEPVERLAERVRGVEGQDFSSRIDLHREDELGELAVAFDHMSQKLGAQFATLGALAEIDRLILTTQDISQVTHRVLARLVQMTGADSVTVLLFDGEQIDHARTYSMERGQEGEGTMSRHRFTAADRALLAEAQTDWPSLAVEALPAFLQPVHERGMASAYLHPIVWRGTSWGAVVLGFRAPRAASDEERKAVADLADRIAVAVSSAWRDKQLYEQSHYDSVTGVPNRLLFRDRLRVEIVRSSREKLQFGVLFVDLDHFKHVNDSFGHSVGDAVLREAADRLARCVRTSDSIARLGGDEFTVLITNLQHAQEAWLIAETIVEAFSREFIVDEHRCFLSASVGIATYPDDGTTEEALVKSADTAMYRAKAAGRAQAVFFEEGMNREAVARVALDRELRMAIERGELELHYQPQVELGSGKVTGAEALVRWRHPTHGWVPPSRFIPLAEESGFIETIGQWVIREASRQMRAWRDAGLALPRVSVNVSPRQFRRKGLVEFIAMCVDEAGITPSALEIEVTEGVLLDRSEAVEGVLQELADRGHGIALDDFGTGFSSMAYLQRFPVHLIKIDRVFVEGLRTAGGSQAIVAAIVAMGHALGKRVLAEGAETGDQMAQLRALGCDEVQGYYVSAALRFDDFAAFCRARERQPQSA